jgi:hypothetical protein
LISHKEINGPFSLKGRGGGGGGKHKENTSKSQFITRFFLKGKKKKIILLSSLTHEYYSTATLGTRKTQFKMTNKIYSKDAN